jgi:hypothetical protein
MKSLPKKPRVVILPGDTSFDKVRAKCKKENLRPTIDAETKQWVLRPNLRSVK